jgi:RNA polymerase primary sigma factor
MTAMVAIPNHSESQPISPQQAKALKAHVARLLRTEISFIPSPDFHVEGFQDSPAVEAALNGSEDTIDSHADLPAHLQRLCETQLLTADQEQELFRAMNYLKFRANALRSRLNPERIEPDMVEAIDSMLAKAEAIRNHIIRANMRLVMAISKKYVSSHVTFDEMLSDGTITLMKTVEKFDYTRGFRFSTYAYRSIVRNAYQSLMTARNDQARYVRDAEQWAFEQEERSSSLSDQRWERLRKLAATMLDDLDRRERFIIRSRFALGVHRKVRTLQSLADRLGVSKERVRQLEQRALGKLSAMAAKYDLDDLMKSSALSTQ